MKSRKLLFFIGILIFWFVSMSNRIGRGNRSGQGVTTAPGESGNYCGSFGCHFSGNFNTEAELYLLDSNSEPVDKYIPGNEYLVNIKLNHTGNPIGFGYQIVSLLDSDETGINTWSDFPNNIGDIQIMGRQYVEHNNILPQDSIILNWTAPESGSGDITFYAAGNVVNANGSSSGDSADTVRLSIVEDIQASLTNFTEDLNTIVYPNPAFDKIFFKSDYQISSADLFDINGKLVLQKKNANQMDIENLNAGVYILGIQFQNNSMHHQKIIVR